MTLSTRSDRYIRFQPAQRGCFRDVDVTRRTFRDVLFLLTTAIVYKLRGDSFRRFLRCVRRREFVTAVAVIGHWLLRFPVTVETRRMIGRHSFERLGALAVTNRAVVVTLRRMRESQQGDYVLMPVMRKLDRELS